MSPSLAAAVVVIVGSFWVYLDATKHGIGRVCSSGASFNYPAWQWFVGSLLLFIVIFPAYLLNRATLLERAREHPQVVSNREGKAAFFGFVSVAALWYLAFGGGLSSGIPNCTDPRTVQLAQRILGDLVRQRTGTPANVSISGIRTLSASNGFQCEAVADLQLMNGKSITGRIVTYTSTASDDGRHLVQVQLR